MRSIRTGSSHWDWEQSNFISCFVDQSKSLLLMRVEYKGEQEELGDVADFRDQKGMRNNT